MSDSPIFMACPACQKGVEVWVEACPYCGADVHAPEGLPNVYEEEQPCVPVLPWWQAPYEQIGYLWGCSLLGLWALVILCAIIF